jgi:peptidyl-prolyl cis-trans isomerase A (cyclophilin A)
MRDLSSVTLLFASIALLACAPACDKQKAGSDDEAAEQQTDESGESGESAESEGASSEESGESGEMAGSGESAEVDEALLKPEEADEKAPETFKVKFETTKGEFVGEFNRKWAPNGADRLYNLVKIGFYDNVAFFRVIDGFMAQFGMKGVPKVDAAWQKATIEDDPVEKPNKRGYITFAQRQQPNSRTTQLFINYTNNSESLDKRGFAPVGKVVEGMDVVEELHAGYGEGAPRGNGPSQKKLRNEGNSYLRENFPKLDWLESASIVESGGGDEASKDSGK